MADIEQRLGDRFRLLTGGGSTALPRHQTLKALIDWSYDLLDGREQLVLCRLSAFSGGCSLEAAESVCSRGDLERWEVLDILGSLVDKSLVQGETSSGNSRFRLLETIRRYVADKLSELGQPEEDSTRLSHAQVFLALAEEAGPHLSRSERARWFDRVKLDIDNLRAAMAYFTSDQATIGEALRIGVALRDFWFYGFLSQGIEAIEATLPDSNDGALPGLRSSAILSVAYLHFEQGDYAVAQSQFEDVMNTGQSIDDSSLTAEALGGLGLLALRHGDIEEALELTQKSVALAEASGNQYVMADAFSHRGAVKLVSGDSSDREDFDKALAGFRAVDNRFGIARVLQSLAIRELKEGNLIGARAYVNESLNLGQEMSSDGRAIHATLQLLGLVELLSGDTSAAYGAYRELLTEARRLGTQPFVAYAFLGIGFCASSTGDGRRAVMLHGAADALFERLGDALDRDLQRLRKRDHSHLRRTMGDAAFDTAYEAGRQLTSHGAIELAMQRPTID